MWLLSETGAAVSIEPEAVAILGMDVPCDETVFVSVVPAEVFNLAAVELCLTPANGRSEFAVEFVELPYDALLPPPVLFPCAAVV
jgi:hypothetical protein